MTKARDHATVVASWCAALLMAQFVGSRATRDALYLAHMPVTTLPAVVMTSAVASIVLAFAWSRLVTRIAPARFLTAVLLAAGGLFIVDWVLFPAMPRLTAVMVYVQVTVLGPLAGSGLWLVASERFDPRAARTAFARMVSAGAVGGLVGGVITERAGTFWGPFRVLWLLSAAAIVAAYAMHRLGRVPTTTPAALEPTAAAADSSVRVLTGTPILRSLAALVLLSAMSAALLDFLFKSEAVISLGSGTRLLQFFAWYYAAAGVMVFVVQTSLHEVALEKLGLARTVMTPAVAVVAGGLGALAFPGITGITAVRGAESVFRGSLFRSAYEIFFTPVPAARKRAAKSVIDVAVDRLGEAAGAGVVALIVAGFATRWHYPLLLTLALVASLGVVVVAQRLTRGYIAALERSLHDHAVALPMIDVRDRTTRAVIWQTMGWPPSTGALNSEVEGSSGGSMPAHAAVFDRDLLQVLALRSGQTARIARVLDPRNALTASLIAHVVPLLESPAHAGLAAQALTAAAQDHAGALTDALLDPRRSAGLRRRLARILAGNPSPRAVDGLLAALSSGDFSVRVQCGRSLARIHATHPALSIADRTVIRAVLAELARESAEWERHRPLLHAEDDEGGFLDEHVRQRAHQGLAHVFALLSIILPADPLRIAYRGLHTDDRSLRGTALEYLESVLPKEVREALWPFIGDGRLRQALPAPGTDALTRLVEAHPSILVNLQQPRVR